MSSIRMKALNEYDVLGLYAAMDAQRTQRGLSWRQVAGEIWRQSVVLNERRKDHPISPATLRGIAKRGDTTCQHALFILRWLGRTPESFFTAPPSSEGEYVLPSLGPDRRLRWNLGAVYEALDARRRERALTWKEIAEELRCTDNQLRGIRTAKYAIGMKLMMGIVQWLEKPAATFIYAAKW